MPSWAPEAFQSGLVLGALLGLVLYNSAVLAEIMRAGILSLPQGPGRGGRPRSGMTYRQSLRHVILPQGLRRMVPATVSQLITLNKDTTLVSIIAITEVMRRARIVTASNFFTVVEAPILHVFIFVGLLFVIVNYALSRLSRRLELRERKLTGTKLKRVRGLEDQVGGRPGLSAGRCQTLLSANSRISSSTSTTCRPSAPLARCGVPSRTARQRSSRPRPRALSCHSETSGSVSSGSPRRARTTGPSNVFGSPPSSVPSRPWTSTP